MNTKRKQSESTESIQAESVAIQPHVCEKLPEEKANEALAFLVSYYGLTSASIAERALKAASLASNANSAHGAMRSKLPIVSESEKLGKVSKDFVTDGDKVKRDASSLSSDERKRYNSLRDIVEAAKLLGILAPKAR